MSKVAARVALVCPFGLRPKATVSARAAPIAHELQRRGREVRLFVPPWDDPDSAGRVVDISGVAAEHVGLSGGPIPVFFRLVQAVARFRPDLVHVFKPIGFSGGVAQLNSLRSVVPGRRLPLVLDGDDWEGPGGWNERRSLPGWARGIGSWQERWCYRHADALTLASDELRTIAWSLGVQPSRVFPVPNGLTAPLPAPAPDDIQEVRRLYALPTDTVVLYTRLVEFVPAWPVALLAALRAINPGVQMLVVGKGLAAEERSLLEAAQSAGLAEALKYAGWVPAEDLPRHLCAGRVAIAPFEDNLVSRTKCSVKLLELMSLGLPIVASAVGENVHYLAHGRAGVLLPPPLDAERWAIEIASLLADGPRREQLGQAAALRVREEYLWSRLVDRVEAAYLAATLPAPRRTPGA